MASRRLASASADARAWKTVLAPPRLQIGSPATSLTARSLGVGRRLPRAMQLRPPASCGRPGRTFHVQLSAGYGLAWTPVSSGQVGGVRDAADPPVDAHRGADGPRGHGRICATVPPPNARPTFHVKRHQQSGIGSSLERSALVSPRLLGTYQRMAIVARRLRQSPQEAVGPAGSPEQASHLPHALRYRPIPRR